MSDPLIVLTVALCTVGIFTTLITARARSFDVSVFWPLAAFFLPLLIATVNLKLGVLPVFSDAQFYDQLVWDTSLAWRRGELLPSTYHNLRTQAYASIVAVLYTVAGRSPFLAILLNTALWGLAVCYWLRLNREAFDVRSEVFGALLVAYPAGLIYAASFLREAVMSLLLVLTLLHLSRWFRTKRFSSLFVGTLSFGALAVFRPETLPIMLVAGSLTLGFDLFSEVSRLKKSALLAVTTCCSVALLLVADVSGYYNPFRVDFLETKRQNLAQYSYSYLANLSYNSWFDVVLYLPVRIFHFLFQPFPWYPQNYSLTFATLDALFLLVVVPLAIIGISRYWSELSSEHILLLAFATLSIVGYALVVSTKGAVTRRRLLSMPVLLLFASLVLPRIRVIYLSNNRG
ncbi:hypothetical protein [Haloarcula sp. 1CSR25-25]|uniref:hypothetical protein n=1 Tax=Haloarcula sp. 1CSR25-25 TaxID=2862545 RepID=UPI0028949907|nr:hypothetical protein [Haloarcula sp. 1CSR25-25]MDT3434235.1 hypothetical protein [Haloarcula sp. 1CSR25-25]